MTAIATAAELLSASATSSLLAMALVRSLAATARRVVPDVTDDDDGGDVDRDDDSGSEAVPNDAGGGGESIGSDLMTPRPVVGGAAKPLPCV